MPPRLARGFASVPNQRQSLSFIIRNDSVRLSNRSSMGEADARCQLLDLSLFLSSLYMHTCICTPSNIDTLCSLWQAQTVCFRVLMSLLYLSNILELSEKPIGHPRCMPAQLAGSWYKLPPHFSFYNSLLPSVNANCKWKSHKLDIHKCLCLSLHSQASFVVAVKWLFASKHPAWQHALVPSWCCIRGPFSSANED